jgi:hypothetical protein
MTRRLLALIGATQYVLARAAFAAPGDDLTAAAVNWSAHDGDQN